MIKQTVEEWREEGHKRFGNKGRDFKFICPKCGNIVSGQDFMDKTQMKPEEAANASVQECIGRHVKGEGCDWASYGLFGTLGKGRIVVIDNREVEVFDFAPIAEAETA